VGVAFSIGDYRMQDKLAIAEATATTKMKFSPEQ
jgi:hypothetical protein